MTPALKTSLVLLTTLSLLSEAVVGSRVQSCTKQEMNDLLLNDNVRNCAASFTNMLPKQGCETGLAENACYCHSPVSVPLLGEGSVSEISTLRRISWPQ